MKGNSSPPPLGRAGVGPRKAFLALWRGRYCIATAAPLQSEEGLTGPHPDPPQGEGELLPFINN